MSRMVMIESLNDPAKSRISAAMLTRPESTYRPR
jgi:hypothetical protein